MVNTMCNSNVYCEKSTWRIIRLPRLVAVDISIIKNSISVCMAGYVCLELHEFKT